jgi:hypothetical protein
MNVSDGKIKREVLVGYLLLAVGGLLCITGGVVVSIKVSTLNLAQFDARDSVNNLVILLTLLSIGTLFVGTVSGYLIGKHAPP